jgi:hypothetical protein
MAEINFAILFGIIKKLGFPRLNSDFAYNTISFYFYKPDSNEYIYLEIIDTIFHLTLYKSEEDQKNFYDIYEGDIITEIQKFFKS